MRTEWHYMRGLGDWQIRFLRWFCLASPLLSRTHAYLKINFQFISRFNKEHKGKGRKSNKYKLDISLACPFSVLMIITCYCPLRLLINSIFFISPKSYSPSIDTRLLCTSCDAFLFVLPFNMTCFQTALPRYVPYIFPLSASFCW